MKQILIYSCLALTILLSIGVESSAYANEKVQPGAEQLAEYLPLLKNKRVALVVNQTSIVGKTHLLDTLLRKGINITKLFVPEHGFRGTADAGAHIKNGMDVKTGLPIVSLYGNNKKPKPEQLNDVDIMLIALRQVVLFR